MPPFNTNWNGDVVKKIIPLAATLMIAGCATVPPPTQSLSDDPAIVTINEAVTQIQKENSMLVQIERGKKPLTTRTPMPNIAEFKVPVYLRNWNGPALLGVEAVAADMGYVVKQSGNKPAIVPLVALDSNGDLAYDVLNNISDQCQRHLDLRIDVASKTIFIDYK